jgi:hypothetical protein
MFKSRFQIAGEALPISALSASAAGQPLTMTFVDDREQPP